MENVNFNFASEQEAYEGWIDYNEEREAEADAAGEYAGVMFQTPDFSY